MKFSAELMQFMVLIPAAALCFFPMKNQLAAPPKKIIACIGLVLSLMIPISALILMAGSIPANYVMLPDIAILFLFYHQSLHTHWTTNASVFLMVTALMSFPPNIALCIDCQLHPEETLLSSCLVSSSLQFGISVLFVLLYFLVFKNYFSELIDSLNSAYVWGATLPVPLIFILLNILMQPQKYETMHVNRVYGMYIAYLLLAFFLFNVIYLIFYLVAVILLRNAKTEERVRLFEMQEGQYLAQQRYITESAKQRHDFRQQLHSLAQMAQNKEYDALTCHLADCVAAIPESPTCYSSNIPVNALLNYYDHLFDSQGINKKWNIQIPTECLVNDTELCSLIGNILENVSAGCLTLSEPEKRRHTLNIFVKNGCFLAIKSENRFDGRVNLKNNHYLSTHKGGSGIGLNSIQAIAEKHGGMAYFSHTADTFTIKLIIKILS